MPRLVFGSYDTKHFDPKLIDYICNRQNAAAIKMIRNAVLEYNPSKLTDKTGSTLLHYTAMEGNEVVMKYLVSLGFNVNAVNNEGRTPLMLSVLQNHPSCTEILINANSNIYMKFSYRKNLVQCVFDGTIKCSSHIVEMFMYKMKMEYTNVDQLASALFKFKCPLYYVVNMKDPAVTKIMLDKGCVVNAQAPRHGNTALHRAVYFKDTENVKLLLAYGANVNVRNEGGKIPWRCAPTLDGSIVELDVLSMLLDRKPVLKSLTKKGRMQMYELFLTSEEPAVRMVLQSDVDFSGKDSQGDTVFHYLAANSNLSGAKLLPDKNYDLNSKNNAKMTPLHVAAAKGNFGAMKFLLNNGAHADLKVGVLGYTPLFYALESTSSDRKKCVELLLQRGADIQVIIQKSKTVFDVVQNRKDSVVKILLAHIVMLEAQGTTIVPAIQKKIDTFKEFKRKCDSLTRQLEEMKSDKINESLSLFELLVGETEDILTRVTCDELTLKLKSLNDNYNNFYLYYITSLRRKFNQAIKMIDLFK